MMWMRSVISPAPPLTQHLVNLRANSEIGLDPNHVAIRGKPHEIVEIGRLAPAARSLWINRKQNFGINIADDNAAHARLPFRAEPFRRQPAAKKIGADFRAIQIDGATNAGAMPAPGIGRLPDPRYRRHPAAHRTSITVAPRNAHHVTVASAATAAATVNMKTTASKSDISRIQHRSRRRGRRRSSTSPALTPRAQQSLLDQAGKARTLLTEDAPASRRTPLLWPETAPVAYPDCPARSGAPGTTQMISPSFG